MFAAWWRAESGKWAMLCIDKHAGRVGEGINHPCGTVQQVQEKEGEVQLVLPPWTTMVQ